MEMLELEAKATLAELGLDRLLVEDGSRRRQVSLVGKDKVKTFLLLRHLKIFMQHYMFILPGDGLSRIAENCLSEIGGARHV